MNRVKLQESWRQVGSKAAIFGAASISQTDSWRSWNPPPPPHRSNQRASDPFVGNLVLGIYHQACHWVNRISLKNRVGFSTAAEAQSHGFKPCRICSPATLPRACPWRLTFASLFRLSNQKNLDATGIQT